MSNVPFFDEEKALADLLVADELFCFDADGNGDFVGLTLGCNDTFVPAADGQGFRLEELLAIHASWLADKRWGIIKWIALKRQMRPRPKIVKMMQDEGVWTADLEMLTTTVTY